MLLEPDKLGPQEVVPSSAEELRLCGYGLRPKINSLRAQVTLSQG